MVWSGLLSKVRAQCRHPIRWVWKTVCIWKIITANFGYWISRTTGTMLDFPLSFIIFTSNLGWLSEAQNSDSALATAKKFQLSMKATGELRMMGYGPIFARIHQFSYSPLLEKGHYLGLQNWLGPSTIHPGSRLYLIPSSFANDVAAVMNREMVCVESQQSTSGIHPFHK